MVDKTKKPAKTKVLKTKKTKAKGAITKKVPDVFKPGTKIVVNDYPVTGQGIPPDIKHLDNIQIGYLSTSMKHIVAELDLLLIVRNAGTNEYAEDISSYLSDRISDLRQYLNDNKVIF